MAGIEVRKEVRLDGQDGGPETGTTTTTTTSTSTEPTTPKSTTESSTITVKTDALLDENKHRFVIYPIVHHSMWEMYKKHVACFWVPEEIDLTQDLRDWQT